MSRATRRMDGPASRGAGAAPPIPGVGAGRPPLAGVALLLLSLAACGGPEEPSEVRLTLLGTTDVHGHLLPYDYATDAPREGSLAQVATLADSLRRAEPHVLLFDSGDLLQGTPLNSFRAWRARAGSDGASSRVGSEAGSARAGGGAGGSPVPAAHPVIAAMNAAGYDAAAIGNHEFNYGIPFLRDALEEARFPFLSANTRLAGVDSTAFPPDTVIGRGGVRVAVLGLTTPGVAIWDRANVEGRLAFDDIVEAARRRVPGLRERADVVVVLAHSGLGPGSSYAEETGVPEENAVARLAREVEGIDVIFAGHAHIPVAGERIGGALVLEAGRFAERLAVARLTLRRAGARWEVAASEGELVEVAGVEPAPRVVEAVTADHEATLRWLRQPIGWTPDRWSASDARIRDRPIADLITEVERRASGAELASTAVFDPGAGFGPGSITRRDVLGLYIYPNTLKAVRLSGADLAAYLERSARYFGTWPREPAVNDSVPGYNYDMVSGVEYALDLSRPPGQRVVELRRNGRPVAPGDSLTLALNNYRQSGGGGFASVAAAPLVFSTEEEVSELLIRFIQARDTLRHADVHRENWRIVPAEALRRLEGSAAGVRRH